METIGGRLKKAREKRGLALEDAQKALKIHPSILKALEDDTAHTFLSLVYVRSFLKTYSRYLQLNVEKIIEEYSRKDSGEPKQVLFPGEKKAEKESAKSVEVLNSLKNLKRYTPQILKIAAALLILTAALFITSRAVRFTKKQGSAALHRMRSERTAAPEAAELKLPAINIPRSEPLTLLVKAGQSVWMEVKSDGEVIFRNSIAQGSVEAWKADEKIELWVGKAEALELMLNGIPLGSPGRGVKKGILIDRKGMKLP